MLGNVGGIVLGVKWCRGEDWAPYPLITYLAVFKRNSNQLTLLSTELLSHLFVGTQFTTLQLPAVVSTRQAEVDCLAYKLRPLWSEAVAIDWCGI